MFDLLDHRARYNRRSMSAEVVFLIECALAAEIEGNISIVRTLMMAQGGISAAPRPGDEEAA